MLGWNLSMTNNMKVGHILLNVKVHLILFKIDTKMVMS